MAGTMCGKQGGDKLKCVPLRENTVGRFREGSAGSLKKQVLGHTMQRGKFAVRVDESADVSNVSQLMDLWDDVSLMRYMKM